MLLRVFSRSCAGIPKAAFPMELHLHVQCRIQQGREGPHIRKVPGFYAGQRKDPTEIDQIHVILFQVEFEPVPGKRSVSDPPHEGVFEDRLPQGIGLLPHFKRSPIVVRRGG
jgi:hypothetical protein